MPAGSLDLGSSVVMYKVESTLACSTPNHRSKRFPRAVKDGALSRRRIYISKDLLCVLVLLFQDVIYLCKPFAVTPVVVNVVDLQIGIPLLKAYQLTWIVQD